MLRKRIDPYVTHVGLRAIAPTLPPERHEVVPIAREDVKLDELTAIADIDDVEIRTAIETLAAAICKFAGNSDPLRGIIASNSDPF